MRRIVVTGGPGVGKTTLLFALGALGYATVEESARGIIQERVAAGLSPRPSPLEFAREILQRDIAKYQRSAPSGLLFFDRSVVEALGMLDQAAPLEPRELTQALSRYPYDRRVFVLPPWEAIYVRDHERDQTFAEAIRVHEAVVAWYGQCGYQTCEVPPGTVSARCAYVLRTLEGRVA